MDSRARAQKRNVRGTPERVHEIGIALQGGAAAKYARCLVRKYGDVLLVAVAQPCIARPVCVEDVWVLISCLWTLHWPTLNLRSHTLTMMANQVLSMK